MKTRYFLTGSLFIAVMLHVPADAWGREKLSFEEFLKMGRAQNLDLKIEQAKTDSFKAGAGGFNIPAPMIGWMRMTDQAGSVGNGYEVSQMLPFPAKVTADRAVRNSEFKAQVQARYLAEVEILSRAKLIYLEAWLGQEKTRALQEKKKALEDHLRLARAGARSDSFQRIHVLKTESDLDLLENDLLATEQQAREKLVALAVFLNRDPSEFQPDLEDLALSVVPARAQSSAQLEQLALTYEISKAKEDQARASWFPDLFLRYRQTGQTEMMPRTSELMVGLSLPFVFPWDVQATTGKAYAERARAELEFAREKRKLASDREILFARAGALKKQIDNINQKLLARAERRMRLVHNVAPRDLETLQDHRETMEAFPELRLKSLELRAQYEQVIADLQLQIAGVQNE